MQKLLIIDPVKPFLADIETRLLLSPLDEYDIAVSSDVDNIGKVIAEEEPDKIVANTSVLANGYWDTDIETIAYARKKEDLNNILAQGFKSYGVITKAGQLIEAIEGNRTVSVEDGEGREKSAETSQNRRRRRRKRHEDSDRKSNTESDALEGRKSSSRKSVREDDDEDVFDDIESIIDDEPPARPKGKPSRPHSPDPERRSSDDRPKRKKPVQENRPAPKKKRRPDPDYYDSEYDDYEDDYREDEQDDEYVSVRDRMKKSREREELEDRRRRKRERRKADYDVEEDIGHHKKAAKVVTFYSAKGGVGKTTFACEVSEYLAMTENGRRNYNVCLVDFNIDFGDVLNTLMLDPSGPNMTEWDADIKARLENGEKPSEIQYSKDEIAKYLQHDEDTGLSILVAPVSNEDSMEFEDDEFPIMVDNLKNNGGFDYVVFDTGNNTRDSSVVALLSSDTVYLVLTQSINAASDNGGFLSTIKLLGFKMDHIKLIINMQRPEKAVKVGVDEIVENFVNPNTGRPYDVAATVPYSTEVIRAANDGIPLVKDPRSDFTKLIGQLVADLTQHKFTIEAPKKKGFFAKLFSK